MTTIDLSKARVGDEVLVKGIAHTHATDSGSTILVRFQEDGGNALVWVRPGDVHSIIPKPLVRGDEALRHSELPEAVFEIREIIGDHAWIRRKGQGGCGFICNAAELTRAPDP